MAVNNKYTYYLALSLVDMICLLDSGLEKTDSKQVWFISLNKYICRKKYINYINDINN